MTPRRPGVGRPSGNGLGRLWPPLAAAALLLGGWELYVDLGGVDPLVLPAPHAVAVALVEHRDELLSNLGTTFVEVSLGMLAGTLVAVAIAVAVHLSTLLHRALLPLLIASQAVPIVLVAVLLVIWLGFGLGTKVAVIALISFFPIAVTTLAALEATDPELIRLARSLGADRRQVLRLIEAPAALLGLFTGLRLAAVASVTGAVFAELSGASTGLGYLFVVSFNQLEAPVAFAAVTVLTLFAITLYLALLGLERRLLPWAQRPRG